MPKKKKTESNIAVQSEASYQRIMDQCVTLAKEMDSDKAKLLADLLVKAKLSRPRLPLASSPRRSSPAQRRTSKRRTSPRSAQSKA